MSFGPIMRPGRDPEREARSLRRRFRAVSRRIERRTFVRRHAVWLAFCLLVACLGFAAFASGVFDPWLSPGAMRHLPWPR